MRYELPEGWEKVKLGEITSFRNGRKAKVVKGINNCKYPLYGGNGMYGSTQSFNSEDSIIIGRVGAYCGSVHNGEGRIWISDNAIEAKPKNDMMVLNKYLYYRLVSLNLNRLHQGTSQPLLNQFILKSININLPPLNEQKAIADTLSALDDKIELNNKINQNLEAQAQAIFKHWFIDFEFPDKNGNPYKSSGGEMVESELGMIPKGWEVCRLDEIANITMGQSPRGTTYNEIGEGAVFYQGRTDFTARFPQRRLYTTDPKRMAKRGDILMSVRAPVGDINIANEDCCIGRGLCSLNSKSNMNSYLLHTLFQLKNEYDVFNREGTVFGSINQKELKGIKIVKPADRLAKAYNNMASYLDKKYSVLDKESRTLVNARDTLLPKLMSGEIRIPLENQ